MRHALAAIALLQLSVPAAATEPVGQAGWFPGSSSIREIEAFPPAYRGRWAPNAEACADQDGVDRIFVMAAGVDSYESGGRLQRVTQAGQERSIKVRLAYEGEGISGMPPRPGRSTRWALA
jgi:hypothetical protein